MDGRGLFLNSGCDFWTITLNLDLFCRFSRLKYFCEAISRITESFFQPISKIYDICHLKILAIICYNTLLVLTHI